ncbi:GNAT family N-acetyltransferase [Candidatus Magnetaquicoccus inordinatus]|uniref:GNAT family N-acetyltransferase n=1 Tax=Candidatus Magnetaquicoccus inordinatus TaxID=2496818 RepID=UPI00187D1A13|nr:GNAT family N-acetyltransferase [Candidatus Magnetaquicoccus inordinatus]
MAYRIERVDAGERVAQLLAETSALVSAEEPFLYYNNSLPWVRLCWQQLEAKRGSRLLLLLIRNDLGAVVGWWPLLLSRRKLGYRLQGIGQEYSDYTLPFLRRSCIGDWQEIFSLLLQELQKLQYLWSYGYLPALHLPGQEIQQTEELFCQHAWQVSRHRLNYVLDLPADGGMERILQERFSASSRKSLRYEVNRLQRICPLRLLSVVDTEGLRTAESFFRNHYQYGAQEAKVALWFAYLQETLHTGSRISLLLAGDEVINMIIAFARGGEIDFFSTVFHQEWGRYSPGKVHLYHFIAGLIAEGGIHRLNFLTGEEPYKAKWANHAYATIRLYHYHAATPLAWCYRLANRWKNKKQR